MPLVAKRKLTETWREAVAKRGQEFAREDQWLRVFDAHLAEGKHEAEAAYMTLARFKALFLVSDGPVRGRRREI